MRDSAINAQGACMLGALRIASLSLPDAKPKRLRVLRNARSPSYKKALSAHVLGSTCAGIPSDSPALKALLNSGRLKDYARSKHPSTLNPRRGLMHGAESSHSPMLQSIWRPRESIQKLPLRVSRMFLRRLYGSFIGSLTLCRPTHRPGCPLRSAFALLGHRWSACFRPCGRPGRPTL